MGDSGLFNPLGSVRRLSGYESFHSAKRRNHIAEILTEKNFDLAFQVICQFNLRAVDIYAAVSASLADRKTGNQLTEFLKNINGTIHEDDSDQIPNHFT